MSHEGSPAAAGGRTQKYVSRGLGTAEEMLGTDSHTQGPHGASVTHSQLRRFRPLLTPQEFRRMPDHVVVAFLPACRPTALARMDWREHPTLRQRSEMRPPEQTTLDVVVPCLPHAPSQDTLSRTDDGRNLQSEPALGLRRRPDGGNDPGVDLTATKFC
jgi:type IV secretory pathway TraG/TraD family ATPase VirD4